MKSKRMNKQKFINEIIKRIETHFKDTIVIWCGTGIPDEDLDDTEMFEALWITDQDYNRFNDFTWDLHKNFAEPNGYSIMVDSLSPEITREFRWTEYQEGLARRNMAKAETG